MAKSMSVLTIIPAERTKANKDHQRYGGGNKNEYPITIEDKKI